MSSTMSQTHLITKVRQSSVEDAIDEITDVLNGNAWLYEACDYRVDIRPYSQLTVALRNESEHVSGVISEICAVLFERSLNSGTSLTPEGKTNLLIVLRDCDSRATSCVVTTLIDDTKALTADFRARLLQILVAKEVRQSIPFWERQNSILGPDYAALVFSGMLLHGEFVAFSYFNQVFTSSESLTSLIPIVPWLIDKRGTVEAAFFFRLVLDTMPMPMRERLTKILSMFGLQTVFTPLYFGAPSSNLHREVVPACQKHRERWQCDPPDPAGAEKPSGWNMDKSSLGVELAP